MDALFSFVLIDEETGSDEHRVQREAYVVLVASLDGDRTGTPYPEAFDALVRAYPTRAGTGAG